MVLSQLEWYYMYLELVLIGILHTSQDSLIYIDGVSTGIVEEIQVAQR